MTVRPAKTDQPGHPLSLIRVCAVRSMVAKDQAFFMRIAKTDQTGRMPGADLSSRGHSTFCWFCHEVALTFSV